MCRRSAAFTSPIAAHPMPFPQLPRAQFSGTKTETRSKQKSRRSAISWRSAAGCPTRAYEMPCPGRCRPTVGKYRKKQRIHAGMFLKHIKDFLGTFIHERNCSDLDADHFRGYSRCPEVGMAKAAPAPAVIFRNSRRFTSTFNMGYAYFLW